MKTYHKSYKYPNLKSIRNIHTGKIDHMTTSSHKTIVSDKFVNKNNALNDFDNCFTKKYKQNIHTTYIQPKKQKTKTNTPDVMMTKCYLPIGQ